MPSWKEVKKSYNEAKRTVARSYNEAKSTVKNSYKEAKKTITQTKDNVVKTTKQTAKDVQKWTKDHKEQLLTGAKIIQKTGDNMTTAGLIGAAAGAPIAGVGAAPGLAVATWGGAVSTFGSVVEIGVKFITEDEEASQDVGIFLASKATEAVVNKVLPGAGNEASKVVKDAVKVTREIIKNETSNKTKDIITEQTK